MHEIKNMYKIGSSIRYQISKTVKLLMAAPLNPVFHGALPLIHQQGLCYSTLLIHSFSKYWLDNWK